MGVVSDTRSAKDDPAISVRLLRESDRAAAGELIAAAFPDKMRHMLPHETGAAAAIMRDLIVPGPNTWVAEIDGGIAGIMMVKDHGVPSTGKVQWGVLRRHLGLWRGLRAYAFCAIVYTASLPEDRMYIDTLAVHPDREGRGVAGELLRSAIAEAGRRRHAGVTLYVVAGNDRARAIYERAGFRRLRTLHLWWCAWLVGFRDTEYMELKLAPADPS